MVHGQPEIGQSEIRLTVTGSIPVPQFQVRFFETARTMNAEQGYYSIIQYCPDFTRMEVCNLGVLLFCPKPRYLGVMMTDTNERELRFFGKKAVGFIQGMGLKASIVNRIAHEKIVTLEHLERFIETRANSIVITKPRSIWIEGSPRRELSSLYRAVFKD